MVSLRATEDDEQEAVVMYCNLLGIDVSHIPNEGKRSWQYGAKLKRMGLQKGFPDLFFPYARKNAHGLFIEMKRKGEKPTVEQIAWLKKLKERNYKAFLCQGFDEAKRVIDWYFEVER